jgi:hypothetical protein
MPDNVTAYASLSTHITHTYATFKACQRVPLHL